MSADIKEAVQDAALRILQPLARVLLEARVGVGEFHALAKLAYVQAAVEQGRVAGDARPNVSRIAAATGLTRPDIAAHLDQPAGTAPPVRRGRSRAESVLLGWHEDRDFLDPRTDAPAPLKRQGARRSFASLARRYSGDTNPAAILHELLRAGAARVLEDGRIEALSRTCANVGWDSEGLEVLGVAVAEYLETLIHNLNHPEAPRYARSVECTRLDAQAARVLIPEIREHADVFLESTEISLAHPKQAPKTQSARNDALRFVVAVHFFQTRAHRDERSSSLPKRRSLRPLKRKRLSSRRPPLKSGAGGD